MSAIRWLHYLFFVVVDFVVVFLFFDKMDRGSQGIY